MQRGWADFCNILQGPHCSEWPYRHHIQTAVQCRGGPPALQVDITFNGLWQWPLRDGQQRGRVDGAADRGAGKKLCFSEDPLGLTIRVILVLVSHRRWLIAERARLHGIIESLCLRLWAYKFSQGRRSSHIYPNVIKRQL